MLVIRSRRAVWRAYVPDAERNQGHGFRDEKASTGFYSRLEQFLAKNLAPEGSAKSGKERVIDLPARK